MRRHPDDLDPTARLAAAFKVTLLVIVIGFLAYTGGRALVTPGGVTLGDVTDVPAADAPATTRPACDDATAAGNRADAASDANADVGTRDHHARAY